MFKVIRAIRKILAALFFLLGTVAVATGVYCYRYQDQIIQKLLDEVSKWSSYPIQMRAVQFAMLKPFPNIALACYDVTVKDCTEAATDLITVRKLYCTFDAWKLVQGQYVLTHLYLQHGKLRLDKNVSLPLGMKSGAQKVAQRGVPLLVGLQNLHLKDVEVLCGSKQQYCRISVEQMQAGLKWEHASLVAELQGRAVIRSVQIKDLSLAKDLPLLLKASLYYDQQKKIWTVRSTQLKQGNSLLNVQGNWGLEAASSVALKIQGEGVDPQLLLRCFPKQYYQISKRYNPRGQLVFNFKIDKQPSQLFTLQGDFALRNGAVIVSQSPTPIELCQLSGHLSIPHIQDLKTATLSVDRLVGKIANSKLAGSLTLRDFHNLYLQCIVKATLDLASLRTLFTHSLIKDASGKLNFHGRFDGCLQQFMRGTHTRDGLFFSGELQTQVVQFGTGVSQLLCKDLVGKFHFKNDALIMQDFSGSIGPGSFTLAGTVHNLVPYLFLDAPRLCADAQLYMDYLDLDALLYSKCISVAPASVIPTKFDIAPQWALNLDCDLQQFHYRRFRGKNIRGKIKIKDQKLIAEKLQLGVSGGKIFLDGAIDASANNLNIHTTAKLQDVRIAELFYTFENFRQNFLTDRHLSGKIFSDVDLTMQTDKQGNMCWDALNATIDLRMIGGGLHGFDPMQQLAKYVDKEHLANLRFSELKNHILVKEKVIYIPPMEVHASPTRIQLSGTHTFDGKIDYIFGVPFAGFQEKTGGSEETKRAVDPQLFFRLLGDTSHYKISYDAKASRKNLAKAIKTQGKVLKDIIRGAYRRNKQLQELASDDYFEFDE